MGKIWNKFKKAVGGFFSDEYPEVTPKIMNVHEDQAAADAVRTEKVRKLLVGMQAQKMLSVSGAVTEAMGNMDLSVQRTGAMEMGGFRYLFDTEAGVIEGVRMIPESFKKHVVWENKLKPGMLGRMLRPITIEAPKWKASQPVQGKYTASQPVFTFKEDADPARSIDVSEGDILMFVGFITGPVNDSDLETFNEMYLPISVQQWIVNERTVEFSFIEEEIDMFFTEGGKKSGTD